MSNTQQADTDTRGPGRMPVWVRIFAWSFILLLVYLQRQADTDLWGHIVYGRDWWTHRTVSETDPYAYTNPGHRWIGHEVSSEVVFYLVWKHTGVPGLIVFRMLMGLAILLVIRDALRLGAPGPDAPGPGGASGWLPCLTLLAAALAINLLVRPQLFTYLFLALTVDIIQRCRFTPRKGIAWAIPPLIWLWTGFHGGFVAGLGLWLAFAGFHGLHATRTLRAARGAGRRDADASGRMGRWVRAMRQGFVTSWRFWAAGALAAVLTFFNPTAPRIWSGILTALTNPLTPRHIIEWRHVLSSFPSYPDFCFIAYALLMLAALAGLRPFRDTVGVGLALLMLAVAASSYRHITLMAIVLTPVLGGWLEAAWRRVDLRARAQGMLLAISILAVGLGTLLCFILLQRTWRPVMAWRYPMPQAACRFIRQTGLKGNVYCEFAWGQYIIWHLGDLCQVGMDGRYDTAYPLDVIRKHLDFLYKGDTSGVEEPPADMILVDARSTRVDGREVPRRASIARLMQQPEWTLVYRDQLASLFLRTRDVPVFRRQNLRLGPLPVHGKNPSKGYFP